MYKAGNVWYPKSQKKLAQQVARWIHHGFITEIRKMRKNGTRKYYYSRHSSRKGSH